MDRKQVVSALEETAVLLELQGENPFKIRAYSQAARTILGLETDLAQMVETGEISQVKGIGKTMAAHVDELVKTGRLQYLEELKAAVPPGFLDLLKIQGLGPKKIKSLHDQLGVTTLGELEYACRENRLVSLKGFGSKSQAKVLEGIENLKKYQGRRLWAEAEASALALKEALASCPQVRRVEIGGSFRRRMETVKDLDLVVETDDPQAVADCLAEMDIVESEVGGGDAKLNFRIAAGLSVDVRLVSAEAFPFALVHFTGSKEHNTVLRRRAKDRDLKLNEYGLFDQNGRGPSADDEAGVYDLLGLPLIPPELRENLGEFEAAEKGALPDLVEPQDIRGVFHAHSDFSDGGLPVKEMIQGCLDLGYEYLGLSDHSQTAFYAGGLKEDDLKRQRDLVEKLRAEFPDFGLFWGIESDILPDGSLDYPEEVLARFDFVIASIHSSFHLPEKENTQRLIRAAQNPFTTIMGHLTGRLLLAREPYALDLPAVLEAAADAGTVVEINANPHRLDLDWREMRRAKQLGLKLAVCPDAHSAEGLSHARYGVYAARKGWQTKDDIINCRPLKAVAEYFEQRRARAR